MADEVLKAVAGTYELEVEFGPIAWSNELALHVIELKTVDPVPTLAGVAGSLPGACRTHPRRCWRRWGPRCCRRRCIPGWTRTASCGCGRTSPTSIYATFNRIFDCRGHGWANLQSTHLNLPFGDDDEFGRLHAAMRLVLPLAAGTGGQFASRSTGGLTGLMDTRLDVYRHNADRVPSVAGQVVPEAVFTRADYESVLLQRIYDDLEPLDPEGILRHEWVNARGCIARFDRMAIEIRLIDAQECPAADVAVSTAVVAAVRALVEERWNGVASQQAWDERRLSAILDDVIRGGDVAVIRDREYLEALGCGGREHARAGDVWRHLLDGEAGAWLPDESRAPLDLIMTRGCLARRIMTAVGDRPDQARLAEVYRQLADCLATGRMFGGV